MPLRTLSEAEFEQVKAQVLAQAPPNLTEAEFTRWAGPAMAVALTEAEARPAGSAWHRFTSNAGAVLNPITMATGLYEAVKSPEATGKTVENIYRAGEAEALKAAEAYRQGHYFEMVGHGAAAALPVIGPASAAAGEQIASGDIAGGLGTGVGLVGSMVAPSVIKAGARRLPLPSRAAVAEGLQAGAEERVASVMSPAGQSKVKVRMGNTAADVAPTLLTEPGLTSAWSREGLRANVGAAFQEATAALDAVHDARLSARTFKTQPLIDSLLAKRRLLTSEAVEGSGVGYQQITVGGKPVTLWSKATGAAGADVVPGPNAPRVAQIDQAIAELRRLGPDARYEPLRVMRAAYDIPAEVTYNPSVTADFLTKQGGARGAADVTGTLREFLAGHEPATAAANARYSVLKSANTVLEATAELERVRPAVGRRIMTAFLGGMGGTALAGVPGMVGGAILAPIVDATVSAGVTTKLQTARLMTELATAIRNNNPRAAASVGARLRRQVPQLGSLLEQLRAPAPAGAPAAGSAADQPGAPGRP